MVWPSRCSFAPGAAAATAAVGLLLVLATAALSEERGAANSKDATRQTTFKPFVGAEGGYDTNLDNRVQAKASHYEMVQAGGADAAEVHAGPLADRLESFENGDVFRGVICHWLDLRDRYRLPRPPVARTRP